MTDQIIYTKCPSCHSSHIAKRLTAIDYTVTNESFEIWQCNDCSLRFTQNIPGQERIGRYYQSDSYISHSNTDKGIVNRLYKSVRRITMKSKRQTVSAFSNRKQGSLLDLGAGTGVFASFMQGSGWKVTGLEPDEQARKNAAHLHNINLEDSSLLFELPPDSFDAITLWHVIEHVHSLHPYLNQLKKLLKADGIMFIAVPNYTSYDAGLYNEFWAAYDTPRHLYHFSPEAMRKLLESHGLQLQSIKPMWFDSFYVSLLSEKYKSGHSNLLKGFWNGAVSNLKALFKKDKASSLTYIIRRL